MNFIDIIYIQKMDKLNLIRKLGIQIWIIIYKLGNK